MTARALLLVLVLLGTAGCGLAGIGRDPDAALRGAASTPGAGAVLRAAASMTAAAGGASLRVDAQGPARYRPIGTVGEGLVDFTRRGASLSLRVGRIGAVAVRVRDHTAYAALPAGAVGGIAQGRDWVSVDLAGADRGLYADTIVQLGTGVTGNPADVPTLLAAVTDDAVALVGPDPVDGAPATRYRATVDLARVAATPALAGVLARYRTDAAPSRGNATVPVEVWLDAAGRLRRVTQLLGDAGATSTVTFTALGPRPRVPTPEARVVTDLLAPLRS